MCIRPTMKIGSPTPIALTNSISSSAHPSVGPTSRIEVAGDTILQKTG